MSEQSPPDKGRRIAVFGSPLIDETFGIRSIADFTPGAELRATFHTMEVGGKAVKAATTLAQLRDIPQDTIHLVGQTGNDTNGWWATYFLEDYGVDTHFLRHSRLLGTGWNLILLDEESRMSKMTTVHSVSSENADPKWRIPVRNVANFSPDPRRIDWFFSKMGTEIDHAYLTLEAPYPVTRRIARSVFKRSIPTFCDMGANFASPSDYLDLLPYLQTVAPNRREAYDFTGVEITNERDASRAADKLLLGGAQEVIITLDKDGSFYKAADGTSYSVPPVPVRHMLTNVGAGDTYRAAFVSEKLRTGDTEQALTFASLAGAFVLTHLENIVPTRPALDAWALAA
jgi:sugar/nucleoside kinase (ribokinase family)